MNTTTHSWRTRTAGATDSADADSVVQNLPVGLLTTPRHRPGWAPYTGVFIQCGLTHDTINVMSGNAPQSKMDKIEELVREDLSNGRHVQKRIIDKLESNGFSPKKIVEELKEYKDGR